MKDLEFWPKERFRGRSLNIYGGPEMVKIPVPDDAILCDFCNTQITEFPVPVYLGNALCPKCLKDLKKNAESETENGS